MTAVRRALVLGLTWLLVGAACSSTATEDRVLVSAAASLTNAFTDIEYAFETAYPGVDVVLNLAGSSALREQILEGAPVDVLASANTATMDTVVAARLVTGVPAIFTSNSLQIAVPVGNPGRVEGLTDFSNQQLIIGLCAAAVPCGSLARTALDAAGIEPAIDTNEPGVRSLLTKIAVGEIDAGIVYVTDVIAARGQVTGVDIATDDNQTARYPIAVIADSPNPQGAANFVAFVFSDEGQAILRQHGFGAP